MNSFELQTSIGESFQLPRNLKEFPFQPDEGTWKRARRDSSWVINY